MNCYTYCLLHLALIRLLIAVESGNNRNKLFSIFLAFSEFAFEFYEHINLSVLHHVRKAKYNNVQ